MTYAGTVEASRVPPDWHGWLHHTYEDPPTKVPFKENSWEKEHAPNLTGTADAYRPEGSLSKSGVRPPPPATIKPGSRSKHEQQQHGRDDHRCDRRGGRGRLSLFRLHQHESGSLGGYEITARMPRVDGLATGTDVRLSGIKIGAVNALTLDPKTYLVTVHMNIRKRRAGARQFVAHW